MENENVRPASPQQINYLKRLGYKGSVEGMTNAEASAIIQQMAQQQQTPNAQPNYNNQNVDYGYNTQPTYQPPQYQPQVAQQNTIDIALSSESLITNRILTEVSNMTEKEGLKLPNNYNVTNACKSAYLKLAECNLLNTDQNALAQALLNMCVQGLNPSKAQCYFINYGGKVTMMRSYHGDRAVCISSGLVTDIQAYCIYDGDEVNITYTEDGYMKVEHQTSWENMNNAIKGAYAMAVLPDGRKLYDIMTYDRIKKSWSMSKNNGKLQSTYDDDACKRTITRHLVKYIFNSSVDNNPIVDSYCESTKNEYINEDEERKNSTIEAVSVEQKTSANQTPPNEFDI